MLHDEKLYTACAIDTEGSISLLKRKRKYGKMIKYHMHIYPRIKIGNTNLEWINYLREFLGIGNITTNGVKFQEHNWKKAYIIVIGGWQDIHDLLEQIIPYLIIKRKQAELLYEASKLHLPNLGRSSKLYSKRIFEIQEEITKLNKKGKINLP